MGHLIHSPVPAACLIGLLASCGLPTPQHAANPSQIIAHWRLVELDGRHLSEVPGLRTFILEFTGDGNIRGDDGCNSFGTVYRLEGRQVVTSGTITATEIACEEPTGGVERRLFEILRQGFEYRLEQGEWLVLSRGQRKLARLRIGNG